jgi:hypothetical protein
MMTGIMLAGLEPTPQAFRCGQPPYTTRAFGAFNCVGRTYPGMFGTQGNGLYRYMNGGKRYMYGSFPKSEMPWFDPNGTVTIFDDLPGADKPPDYKYACYYLCTSPGN